MSAIDQLGSIATRAAAVTLGSAPSSGGNALLDQANPLFSQLDGKDLPALDKLIASLTSQLASAPAAAQQALGSFQSSQAASHGDRVDPPGEIAGFLMLDALERIRSFVASKS